MIEMAQNKVQFQQGLSMEEFMARYATEEQCRDAVFAMRWPDGFSCAECGHDHYRSARNGRQLLCLRCWHENYLTAGTIFADTKLPLTKWFLAMHLLTRDKQGISAVQLMRDVGVSYETAWTMKQKLMLVMQERVEEKPLRGQAVADDVYFGGKQPGHRGRGALGKTPALVAVSLSEEGKPDQASFRVVKGFTGEAVKQWAQQALTTGMSLASDGLACFRAVKEVGVTHYPVVMSDDLNQRDTGAFAWVNTVIANLKTSLLGTYHHVSQKYLARYLAEFEYRFNRRYDLKTILPRLLHAAVHTPAYPEPMLTLTAYSR
jgi:ISXO2-like transposase domain/Transposase zinc-ribbon domain